MPKRRFRLPSPALVISMIALSLVLGGTAVAATATHGDKKADTKLIKKLAPSLSVKHAKTADSATSATSATNATNATHATSADNATHATNADNATTVGGTKVQQFFVSQPPGTGSTPIKSVDGVTLDAACDGGTNPHLSVENDSGQGAMMGGYSSSSGVGNVNRTNLTATPVDLTNLSNGGGVFTVQLRNGPVVSVQWAATGTLGGTVTNCYFSGSLIAS